MTSEKQLKKELRIETGLKLGRTVSSRNEIRNTALPILEYLLKENSLNMEDSRKQLILESHCDDFLGFGPIQKLMNDPLITEIMINGPHSIFIEKKGKKIPAEEKFEDEEHLRNIIEKMLGSTGRRVDESCPYADFSLKDGSRVNVIIPPLAPDGSTVTIRKFLESILSLEDLVILGTLSAAMAQFLKAALTSKLNILFSGATGSGKTTTLGVLCSTLPEEERIITIEDALELHLDQKHVVRLLTRTKNIEGKGEVTVRQLFSNTLRMRPSRIILGELRGEEALDFLQAVNSGHDGTLAVLHASTPLDAIGRLETLAMYAGLNLPSSEIKRQIASGVHLILQHEQMPDGSRKITHVSEICGFSNGVIETSDIFRYILDDEIKDGKISGSFKCLHKPEILKRIHKKGVDIDSFIFNG